MASRRATQQLLIGFCIAGIMAEEFIKFQRFPGFKCDWVSGDAIKALDKAQCAVKGMMKKCWAIQTSPVCQCCDTVTTADNSTAIYSPSTANRLEGEQCLSDSQCPSEEFACSQGICKHCQYGRESPNTCRPCPAGGVLNLVTRKCYYMRTQAKAWVEARDACRAEGFELVKIESAAENTFVCGLRSDYIWIGLNDIGIEGTFVWSDGSQSGYTNWASEEPNDQLGEDCVMSCWGLGKQWNDYQCTTNLYYVCTLKINP